MPRKLPTRPTAEISQNFNSGAVIVYGVTDVAPAGRQPVYKLTQKCVLRYEERQLGIKRLYLSRQNNAEIVRVVRVPCPGIDQLPGHGTDRRRPALPHRHGAGRGGLLPARAGFKPAGRGRKL